MDAHRWSKLAYVLFMMYRVKKRPESAGNKMAQRVAERERGRQRGRGSGRDTGLVDRVWGSQETLLDSHYRHILRQCILLLDSLRFPVYTLKLDVIESRIPQVPMIFLIIERKNNIDP